MNPNTMNGNTQTEQQQPDYSKKFVYFQNEIIDGRELFMRLCQLGVIEEQYRNINVSEMTEEDWRHIVVEGWGYIPDSVAAVTWDTFEDAVEQVRQFKEENRDIFEKLDENKKLLTLKLGYLRNESVSLTQSEKDEVSKDIDRIKDDIDIMKNTLAHWWGEEHDDDYEDEDEDDTETVNERF